MSGSLTFYGFPRKTIFTLCNKSFCFFIQLSEIADGVWCWPVKVKALINSVASRTALACSMLSVFYPKEELAGKRLKDLDQKVIAAIAGKF